jgi:hypothetical protein
MERVGNVRNPLAQVVLEKVLQLCGELDSGWSTSDDNLKYRMLDMITRVI